MESPSEQEKPEGNVVWVRPPIVEMIYGIALFVFVISVFYGAQLVTFCREVILFDPQLSNLPFSTDILKDPRFEAGFNALKTNGNVLSRVNLWSDLIGVLVLILVVYSWKRDRTVEFLGLKPPRLKPLLFWVGAFAVLFVVLEGLAQLLPAMDTEFVRSVVKSSTNFPLLLIGSALLPAIFEEFLIRGLLIGSLRHQLDHHVAIAISSAVFVVLHMQYDWMPLVFVLFPLAIFLGYTRVMTGSLWVSILLHLLNNAVALSFPELP